MSLLRPVLNQYLRLTEKTFLTRAKDATALRRNLELKARLLFHAPLGTRMAWGTLADGPCLTVMPPRVSGVRKILYFHGGAHVFGSPRTHSAMCAALARRVGASATLVQYPLAPEHSFPVAIDYCVAATRAFLAQADDPTQVILGGDSAGGNLVFAVLADLLRAGDPLPGAVFAFSPLMDLTFSGESFATQEAADVVLPAARLRETARGYLDGHPADDPRASPLFADYHGAPPVWITAGDTEVLRDDSRRIAARLDAQDVDVTYVEEHDLPHVWPLFHNTLPEARHTLDALADWIKAQTGARAATR